LLQALPDLCRTVLPARNPVLSLVEMHPLLLDPRVRADLGLAIRLVFKGVVM
jgi:hypothetical protein